MNEDVMLRGLMADGNISLMAISGRDLVEAARQTHDLSLVCTAALGRTLLMCSMMAMELKNPDHRVTTIVKGGGPAGSVVCTGRGDCSVKGYIQNPSYENEPTPEGKLDVGGAVGFEGEISVVRDLGLKAPYVGTSKLITGEIAEDFAQYFNVSEQQPALVYLGIRVDVKSGKTLSAAGLVLKPLPGCPDDVIDGIAARAGKIGTLSELLERPLSLEDAIRELFGDLAPDILETRCPQYRCDCSRERLEGVLIALGEKELVDLIESDHGAELTCHFCNRKYSFSEGELSKLLAQAGGNRGKDGETTDA
ncbi:MAG: Hsp33 family molecular chaperone HslO [Bacillota bacterium]